MGIYKSNELIAQFMGYTADQIQAEEWCGCNVLMENEFTGESTMVAADYHSSWGWLMPVAIKARHIYIKYVLDRLEYGREYEETELNKLAIGADLESVYNAVIKFIQWYNQQSQQ